MNYQSSDTYSSEIFQEHFLALFQAIGFFVLGWPIFTWLLKNRVTLRLLVEKPSTF